MIINANAKINLFLEVVRKRPDGYHDIITLFQEIALSDRIVFKPSRTGILLETDRKELAGDDNIIIKAARSLQKMYGIKRGCRIKLEKRIPIGAGLGGGSADGAASIKALNSLWELGMTSEEMTVAAAALGSDVAFFVKGGTAIGTGRGELLEPVFLPKKYWLLITYPNIFVSTQKVYKALSFCLTKKSKSRIIFKLKESASSSAVEHHVFNRLEQVVFGWYPILAELKEFIVERNALAAAMSGSGSSVFGLFGSEKDASSAYEAFKRKYGFPVWLTETVSRQIE